MDKKDVPKHLRVAAVWGMLRYRPANGEATCFWQLAHRRTRTIFNVGLAAAREMPGAEVTEALAGVVGKLPPERQALLLLAIGDRKDSAPPSLFIAASKSPSPAVREAAIRVLAKHGDAPAITTLLDAALGEPKLAQIAKEGLKRLPGRDVDDAICRRLIGADAKAKVVMLDLIGARQIVAAVPAVREAMADADQAVRLAALAAMAQLIDVKDLDLLIDKAWRKDSDAGRDRRRQDRPGNGRQADGRPRRLRGEAGRASAREPPPGTGRICSNCWARSAARRPWPRWSPPPSRPIRPPRTPPPACWANG